MSASSDDGRLGRSGLLDGPPAIVVAAVGFGLNAAPAREASAHGVGGADLTLARNLVLFTAVGLWARARRIPLAAPRAQWLAILGLGLAGAGVGVGYLSAGAFVPVGVAVMVFYTYPVLIALLTPLVDGRPIRGLALLAFALAICGVALAVVSDPGALDWRGLALAGLAALCATAQLFIASRAPGGGGVATIFWTQAVMIPVALAVALSVGLAGPQAWAAAAVPAFFTNALYMVAYVLQMRGMRGTSAAAAGVIFCLEPIVAMGFAALWLGERLSGAQYLGAALVLAGVGLELWSRLRRPAIAAQASA